MSSISDSNKRILDSLKLLLFEQKETFESEEEGVQRKQQAAKEKVTDAFANLREILAEKERELLDKIDTEFSVATSCISEFLSGIKIEKQKVSELSTGSRDSVSGSYELNTCIEQVKNDIDTNVAVRNDKLNQLCVPYLVLNEQSIEIVKELSFAEVRDSTAAGATHQTESVNSVSNDGDECLPEAMGVSGVPEPTGCSANQEQGSEALGATGISRQDLTPSAPPIDSEAPPPTYWQAVGLCRPQREVEDHQNNRLPKNKLELFNSFSVPKNLRLPVPVALTWNHRRIGIIDKVNIRLQFFYPNGQFINEMVFTDAEPRDVTFLDESYIGEGRYVVTTPKNGTLSIIGVDKKVFRKLVFNEQYLCISRGPRPQTLVGAEVSMTTGIPSVVNLFTFNGQILLSISHTPSFALWQFIRSVKVFGCNIIILDWKLNLVAVYRDDGSAVGEYSGTEHSPLINPSDMTLDNQGNILILNGELQNIHVINLQCQPLEVIEIPKDISRSSSRVTLIAFDTESQRLCLAKSHGGIDIFTFENGYNCLPQSGSSPQLLLPHQNTTNREHRAPKVLPLVEGMLPSTIEAIANRQSARNQNRAVTGKGFFLQ